MRHSVRAVIVNKVNCGLLVQHFERYSQDQGKWSTPGGGIEEGEDHRACLLRELAEEFGPSFVANIQIEKLIYESHLSHRTDYFYSVRYSGDDVKVVASDEILHHGWFTLDEIKLLKLFFGFEVHLFEKVFRQTQDPTDA